MNSHTDSTTQAKTITDSDKPESLVIVQQFILVDKEGRERVTLSTDRQLAMLAFLDKENDPRFSISVSLDGFILMSATHRLDDGKLDDCFSLTISSGEPEIVMSDAIFKGKSVMNARGFFSSEQMG
jgi:hypothetical protein